MTEWPLRHTCGEFWSLVYDYECAAVVVLCVPVQGSTNFPSFWPEGRHSKKYGPVFTIDHISHNHYTNIKTWVRRVPIILARLNLPRAFSPRRRVTLGVAALHGNSRGSPQNSPRKPRVRDSARKIDPISLSLRIACSRSSG